ncbi:NADH:flavin oxidoreductase/NADH oxidase [Paenirhodobacter populi]|uniref:NADH:flavin oxidoreductase/NADH oxidase n=1 Tax=Paenirhodobacter populi TaxID=2306993 RepID=A0A443J6P3_9RHOB|nr:NADH:flavin oxidoreductase/NADH oxidase [Sinirhodobacter populi]RWR16027.1 NADH:flavin oxidoreductase/NADH oxidase [Sinirhodobacter populi]
MSKLFTPIAAGSLMMPNRVVIAPMCQYSAEEGRMTDWHMIHLGQLALSGAGLLTIEATAVSPEGRITYADVGLWDDATEAAMVPVLKAIRRWSDIPVAIQLAHAGRKASTDKPWQGGAQIPPGRPNGWQTVAPSAQPFAPDGNAPEALDKAGMDRIRDAFAEAARRSLRLGVDAIQIHAAHGYLLHQFLSPLSNHREDAYGGSLENRMRFPLEVFDAVKAVVPDDYPVSVRISGTDWVEGGWDIGQTIALAQELRARGCAAIHVSSGGLDPRQQIPVAPGYQVPLARTVKAAVDMPVVAVGLITAFDHAESIVATGDADMVALARGILYDPRWPWHAAAHLGVQVHAAPQYLRCQPRAHRALFLDT